MHHTTMTNPATTGRLIHWARWYDLVVQLLTLGRAKRLRQLTAARVAARPGDHILDVGCGTGDLTLLLARQLGTTGTVVGIDPAPEMIAQARRKAARRGVAVDFHMEPVEQMTFAAHTFDRAVSSLAFHHLPGDLKHQALVALMRVLKPGGTLIIVDFAPGAQHPHQATALTELLATTGFTAMTRSALGFGAIVCVTAQTPPAAGM